MFDYESIKNKVYYYIMIDMITNSDIMRLSEYKLGDLYNLDTKNSYKEKVLLSLYLNPYLLCNDDLLSLDKFDLDVVMNLVIKRYNEEIEEYNRLFSMGDISYNEYINNINVLNKLYFKSSNMGLRILNINQEKIIGKVKRK